LLAAIRAAEGAKSAVFHAYVREVHITVDDVCDDVPDLTSAQFISRENRRMKFAAVRFAQSQTVLPRDLFTFERARKDSADIGIDVIEERHKTAWLMSACNRPTSGRSAGGRNDGSSIK